MNIPFIDLKELHTEALRKDIKARIATIIDEAAFAQAKNVEELERLFGEFQGKGVQCLTTSNGTSSLYLALKAFDIGVGDEVIVSSLTWVATHQAIILAGATPVVVDCELDTFNIDAELLEQHITCKTRAIMPVHICGNPADMNAIMDIADEKGLVVIEDACQAHGAEAHLGMGVYEKCGSIGHVGCFSTYPTKNLGGIGEGGLVTTSDPETYDLMKAIRFFGKNGPNREAPGVFGGNFKMDEIRAAGLLAKFPLLDKWQHKRNGVAGTYKEVIDTLDDMDYQEESHGESVYHLFPILTSKPDEFQAFLEQDKGIGTFRYFNTLPHEAPGIAPHCRVPEETGNAKHIGTHTIYIPCQPYLKKYEIEYVCDALEEYRRIGGINTLFTQVQ